jgi:integrase
VIRSFSVPGTESGKDFAEYLAGFWSYDTSPYIRERPKKGHGVHKNYCQSQNLAVHKYWIPHFEGKSLGEITRRDIEGFMDNLTGVKRRELAASSKNRIIQAGVIALKWAVAKEYIDKDPTTGLVWFSIEPKKRKILTPELAAALFKTLWKDNRARLANLLAAVTGMRAGEILALRVEDLGGDCLYVKNSWNARDGLKTTKTNESRDVELPFPGIIQSLFDLAKDNPHGVGMETYIFWAEKRTGQPMEEYILNRGFRQALQDVGLSQETAVEYTFHGWRHFYTSYMLNRLSDKLLKSQTGHKIDSMLRHYSDHTISGDKEAIQTAQRAAFGNLIEEGPGMAAKDRPRKRPWLIENGPRSGATAASRTLFFLPPYGNGESPGNRPFLRRRSPLDRASRGWFPGRRPVRGGLYPLAVSGLAKLFFSTSC